MLLITIILIILFSPGPGLEAPLNSCLQVALYKFHIDYYHHHNDNHSDITINKNIIIIIA